MDPRLAERRSLSHNFEVRSLRNGPLESNCIKKLQDAKIAPLSRLCVFDRRTGQLPRHAESL